MVLSEQGSGSVLFRCRFFGGIGNRGHSTQQEEIDNAHAHNHHRRRTRRVYRRVRSGQGRGGSDPGGIRPAGRHLPQLRLHPHQDPEGFGGGAGNRAPRGRVRSGRNLRSESRHARHCGAQAPRERYPPRRAGKNLRKTQGPGRHGTRTGDQRLSRQGDKGRRKRGGNRRRQGDHRHRIIYAESAFPAC